MAIFTGGTDEPSYHRTQTHTCQTLRFIWFVFVCVFVHNFFPSGRQEKSGFLVCDVNYCVSPLRFFFFFIVVAVVPVVICCAPCDVFLVLFHSHSLSLYAFCVLGEQIAQPDHPLAHYKYTACTRTVQYSYVTNEDIIRVSLRWENENMQNYRGPWNSSASWRF